MNTTGTNNNDTLVGTGANDTIGGGNGNDTIDGGAGNDSVSGGNGDDILDGGAGSDFVAGNNGNDTAVYVAIDNLNATDVYEGGNGTDTLVLKLTRSQLDEMNASTVFADFRAAVGSNVAFDFSTYGFSFNINLTARDFEEIRTVVIADPAPPLARADVDAITEDGASSTVAGNVLANDALGGIASAVLSVADTGVRTGLYGTLTLHADGGYSYVLDNTNAAVEALNDGDALEEIFSYAITDGYGHATSQLTITINGHTDPLPLFTAGDDVVDFNAIAAGSYRNGTQYDALFGNDTVILPDSAAAATAAGFVVGTAFRTGDGQNTVFGGGLNDIIIGGNGSDTISGGAGNDTLSGGAGDDSLIGGLGNDLIDGGAGFDWYTMTGPGGFLSLAGGITHGVDGVDLLTGIEAVRGSAFSDVIIGNDADNTLAAGAGDDRVEGGAGNDIFIGGEGIDRLDGGAGINRVVYQDSNIAVDVRLEIGVMRKGFGPDAIGFDFLSNIQDVVGSNFNDMITGDAQDNALFGGGGGDFLLGGAGNDRLDGGAGEDVLFGGSGNDRLDGGVGRDVIAGEDGDDWIISDGTFNSMSGGDGIDTIDYSGVLFDMEVNLFSGLSGHPPVRNVNPIDYPFIPDSLFAIENVIGTKFDDLIIGDRGDNRITGFLGNDTLRGLEGRDVFHFDLTGGANVGNDVIIDFEIGVDHISLAGGPHDDLADLNAQQIGEDTVLDLGPGMQLTLLHTNASFLTNGDFMF